ncbi:MAG: LysE family translocator [Bradyrhizobium sp.]|nr:MAG: LysE family translocator [Bradyrhizobium sp.]
MSLAFWLTTLLIVASPGTGVVFTLAAGLSRGRRASLVAAFGCTLGILPHVAAAMLGLAAVLHASALAFAAVKYAGVAYLLFMAWSALREDGALSIDQTSDGRTDLRVIADAILVNLLNPKLSIFFVAFLPQFVSAGDAHPLAQMGELSAAFMAATFVVFALYGLFAAAARDHVLARPRVLNWLRRSFAAAFGALAVRLAFAER